MGRVKSVKVKRKPRTKHNDRAAVAREAADTAVSAWDRVRQRYPAEIVELVDELMDNGFTLADLLRLELLEHFRIDGVIQAFMTRNVKATTLIQHLSSVMLQCRKHMRVIKLSMGEGTLKLGDQPVVLPEGMSYEALMARADKVDSEGDEILS